MMSDPPFASLVELLLARAVDRPERQAYLFLTDGERETASLTWAELDRQARALAALLQERVAPGDRVLMLYPPGLDFVTAFFGCLYAGVTAVPAYPPRPRRADARLEAVAAGSRPAAVLTTAALRERLVERPPPSLAGCVWLATDRGIPADAAAAWRDPGASPETLAFLQYTSGSTANPKGVMVRHGHLLHNEAMIQQAFGQGGELVAVGWLPLYHDMGLIGNVLQPLWAGGRCVLMSPAAFLQRPSRWLRAIGRYRATVSGAPDFAYDLCARKVEPEEHEGLDLSSWRAAFNGAEPVRAATLERFAERFAPYGFRREAFLPCYGLAEATLFVCGTPAGSSPAVRAFDKAALERHAAVPAEETESAAVPLVGCGRPAAGLEVVVVDPETRRRCPPGRVGEVWVAGPSVAAGYWDAPEETERTFCARLDSGEGPWLRTGDLGFFDGGEIFLTGRIKDLVILRGRNHYPQDLERTAEAGHPALRPAGAAAFAVATEDGERLVIVAELERHREAEAAAAAAAVRQAVAEEHEATVHEVALLPAGALPRTSSGKVRRGACREAWLAGTLPVLERSGLDLQEDAREPVGGPGGLSALRDCVARALRLSPDRIDPDRPLSALGLDSLAAIEVQHAVERELGIRFDFASLLEGRSLADLASAATAADAGTWRREDEGADLPLSHGQRGLWLAAELVPGNPVHHIAAAARIVSGLDVEALLRTLQTLADRHPALRTTFREAEGEPVQRAIPGMAPGFRIEDARDWSEDRLLEALDDEARRPFDLEGGPPLRVAVFLRPSGEHAVLLAVHHLVADFWSLAVLAREAGAVYRQETGGPAADLPALAPWDPRRWDALAGPEEERLWTFWKERLAGGFPALDLPADRPRPARWPHRGGVAALPRGLEIDANVRQEHGATLFMVLLAALQALLHRLGGQERFLVGSPTAGRRRPELAPQVGYFVNPVALPADLAGEPGFARLLGQVRETALAAYAHGDYPFPLLVERLQPDREPGRMPLVQTMLVLQRSHLPELEGLAGFALGTAGARVDLGGLALESIALAPPAVELDLTLTAAESEDGLGLALQYSADRFDAATAERWLGHFATLLAAAASHPEVPVSELPLLSPAERLQLIGRWSAGPEALPAGGCLHERVADQGGRTPDSVALVAGEHSLTYRELTRRAADLALHLRGLGVGPEVRVGVSLPRSPEMVVSLLAVLEAGGAYVPLDPAWPGERLAWMMEDSGAVLLLDGKVLPAGSTSPGTAASPRNLAYLLYTSGSTGRPKAVAVEHRSAAALLDWALTAFSPKETAAVLAATSISFDLSVFELFVPLARGGTVVLAENVLALPDLPARDVVTLVNTVPSALAELLRLGPLPASVRTVNLAGEPLPRALVDDLYALGTVERVLNLYGPSEDTTYSTWAEAARDGDHPPAIGRPIAGTRVYVLDRRGEPAPAGVAGELYLGGSGLARGYFGRPDLTAERFVPDPFRLSGEDEPGARLYRTGDLVRFRSGGELEFLGRLDEQVKVRGFRIEPGEIEAILRRHPAVLDAAVVAQDQSLAAWVVLQGEAPPAPLRAWLSSRLPAALVPSRFGILDALPRTPSGKIDRRALARREPERESAGQAPPQTPVEELLAGLWAELLGLEAVDRHARFFALGGHSLLATRLIARVRNVFGVELPLAALFETPTLAGLAARIEVGERALPPIQRLGPGEDRPLSFAQERLWFLAQLGGASAVYNMPSALRLRGRLHAAALERALAEIVRRHEVLRTVFPVLDGRPVASVEERDFQLPVVDAGEAEDDLLRQEAARPFDLARGPLLRACLLRLDDEEHLLLLTLHHIVFDGASAEVFARELSALYGAYAAGRPSPLAEPPVQYGDFAAWQRRWLAGAELERQLAFWRRQLQGAPEALELPADRPRPEVQSLRGATRRFHLPAPLTAEVRRLARHAGATLFMTLLAAFQALLSRLTGQTDLVVGAPVAGRRHAETQGLIGLFVNSLALRADLSGDPAFGELVGRARRSVLAAHEHQDLPFERLVEALQPERSLARSPVFQVMLTLGRQEPVELAGLEVRRLQTDSGTARLDLLLALTETGDDIEAACEYSTDLFDATRIERLGGQLRELLEAAVREPGTALGSLPLLDAAERAELTGETRRLGASRREPERGAGEPAPLQTPAEELLAGLWSELLDLNVVDRHAHFFELGGHSLLATRLVARVRDAFGVELPLTAVFAAPTLAGMAARIESAGTSPVLPPVRRIERGGPLPVSFAQERLWFLDQLEPGSPLYNVAGALRLRGRLDVSALEKALVEIGRRHEVLRSTFRPVEGRPVAVVEEEPGFQLPVADWSGDLLRSEASRPFDLEAGPLWRGLLLRLGPEEHLVLVTFHHSVSDGWSMGVLVREVAALYEAFAAGRPSPLRELSVQYADFAAWQRDWLQGEALETQLGYWRERLAGSVPLDLPGDRPRPAVRSPRGVQVPVELPASLGTALAALGRREGATLFMVLLAALQTLLGRHAGQTDVSVGSPVANRRRPELEGLIGFFANTLVLRADFGDDPPFRELLAQVRRTALDAYAHQDLPFERLVEELQPERTLAGTPLFQAMLVLQNAPMPCLELPGLTVEAYPVDSGTAKFDLTLSLAERDGALAGWLGLPADRFDAVTGHRLAGRFEALLRGIAAGPGLPVAALPLLPEAEQAQLLQEWNDTAVPWTPGLLHRLVEAQAERTPDAIAVEDSREQVSYAGLVRRARRLAGRLAALGVGPEVPAAVAVPPSVELAVGLLAVLEAGGFYVPLDPASPAERRAGMLEDAGARVLLESEAVIAPFSAPPREAEEGSAAYAIFTSGSTGRPKGVLVSHRAIVHRILWGQSVYPLSAADRVLQTAGLGFDFAVWEVFAPLAAGARLVMPPPDRPLVEVVQERGITCLHFVPATLQAALAEPGFARCASLRTVFSGGEALPAALAERFLALSGAELWNQYGPTEATVDVTFHRCRPELRAETVPIGRPIWNTRLYVLDRSLRTVPPGAPGEVHLGGEALARGYLGRPDLTAERFLPDPFGPPGGRLYATGDRVRHLPDGAVEFLGRLDDQVKVRGVRIEPAEVETALLRHPAVREAAVLARQGGGGETVLVAYAATELQPGDLRDHLATRLPPFMVPSLFVPLAELPHTPSGKVDRRALARMPLPGPLSMEPDVAPRTPVEELLAGIYAELLGAERVGPRDGFFDLGGHSLLATRLVSRVRAILGVELPVRAVFESPTVAELAGRIDRAGEVPPAIAKIPRDGALPLSFGQERLWVLDRLAPGSAAYNLPAAVRLRGPLDTPAMAAALAEIVRRHEVLRTTYREVDGTPAQVVAPAEGWALPVVELASWDEAQRLAREEARRPFDLSAEPPLRVKLLRLGADDHLALLTFHHIASDAWSIGVFVRELAALYRASPLPDLPVQYADFAAWQRRRPVDTALAWWRARLAGAPAVLELPADRPRPAERSGAGASRPAALPPSALAGVTALARRAGATPFMVLLAAFQALLARLTGETDLCVGTPVAGRTRVEVEELIGFFVNTLVLRQDLADDPAFGELVGRLRETTLDAHAHQEVPFERLVEELAPQRSLAVSPLFQVLFALQNARTERIALPGLELEVSPVDSGAAQLDLALSLSEEDGRLAGSLQYSTELFDAATIDRLLGCFRTLLEGALAEPGRLLSELPLLSGHERAQLMEWSRGEEIAGVDLPLHRRFERLAAAAPGAGAVVTAGTRWSYAELNARADGLARRLRSLGVGPEVLVALCAERWPALIAGVLAVWKAGGAYLPLDPAWPRERLALMLDDARPAVLLAGADTLARLPETAARVVVLEPEPELGEPLELSAGAAGADGDLAYVLYTSGSTGRPKGAEIPHRGLANLCAAQAASFAPGPGDRVLQFSSPSFDASVFELAMALASGAELHMAGRDDLVPGDPLLAVLRDRAITNATLPPSALAALPPEASRDLPALRTLIVAGEACPPELARRWRTGGRDFWNAYGPTEATVWASVERHGGEGRLTLGRPIANVTLRVLDRALQPLPLGVSGELCIGGPGLARGYRGRPDFTAGRFVPDPSGEPGSRLYRTGDLARLLPDGTFDFLGRIDHQVKVRGVRVEPAEIEARLATHPAVREAAVVAEGEGDGRRLAAFVVPRAAGAPDLAALLRPFLREALPDTLVPSRFVPLPALPLTPSGKVDRRALAGLASGPAPLPATAYAPPRTPAEELLVAIWQQVLEVERIGVHDGFFDRGGHSLLAARMLSRVRAVFGVEVPLRALFEAPTIAGLAAALERGGRETWTAAPLERAPEGAPHPLSFAQQRLWFLDQLDPGSTVYNLPAAFRLLGPLAPAALAEALSEIVRRHESLRTRFGIGPDGPLQLVDPAGPVALTWIDLGGLPAGRRREELERLARAEARRPFDLARGPLLRVLAVRLDAAEHGVLATLHHIIADGGSVAVFARELGMLYGALAAGQPSPLPELPVQYGDYARWQRRWLAGEALAAQLAWWRGELDGVPVLDLPTDRPRPAVQGHRGALRAAALPADLAAALRDLARRRGATLFMVLAAAFETLLSRWSRQDDFALGFPVANRGRRELEEMIGLFANTLALRARLDPARPFAEHLDRVREAALGAYAHQDLPFEKLVEELQPQRDLSRPPLFQVMLVLQNLGLPGGVGGLGLAPVAAPGGTAKFDLELAVDERGATLPVALEHDADLFDAATAGRMLDHLLHLLRAAVAAPETPLADLPLLGEAERHALAVEWNETGRPLPPPLNAAFPVLFAEQAARTPDAVAVSHGDEQLTYRELDRRTAAWARRLARLGAGPETVVALLSERGPGFLTAVLALWKAGAAYLPLDPLHPVPRLAQVLAQSRAPLVLCEPRFAGPLAEVADRAAQLGGARPQVEIWTSGLPEEEGPEPRTGLSPHHLAYVLYTSGSTGVPKGAMIVHRGMVNHLFAKVRELGLTADDAVAQNASQCFDISVWQLAAPLLVGGRVHVVGDEPAHDPRELLAEAERGGVTVLETVPSLLRLLLDEAARDAAAHARLARLRWMIPTGEALPPQLCRDWFALCPGVPLLNAYGPTECSDDVSHHALRRPPPAAAARVPIGRPVPNLRLHVVDARLRRVPAGVPGELLVAGAGVGRGYLRDPSRTAEAFVPDPWPEEPGARLYRTGDLVRRLAGGELEFLGRLDHQVKVRGFRIETGEIEAALAAHPEVREAAVLVREDTPGDARLVAYVAPRGELAPRPEELLAFARERLPGQMVPGAFVSLPALPLTPNGKVDRRALGLLVPPAAPAGPETAPRSDLERAIAGVWREVLGLDRVGVHDSFFDLGGHSLLMVQLRRRLGETLGTEPSLTELFRFPTVASFAASLAGAGSGPRADEAPGDGRERAENRKQRHGQQADRRRAARQRTQSEVKHG